MLSRPQSIFFYALLVLCSAQTAHADTTISTAPTNGLVGYWSFNEGTSTRATDLSRYKNNGTLVGTAQGDWTNGRLGKGLNFDSINNKVDVPSTSSLDDLSAMTLSAWVYTRSIGESGLGRILLKATTGNGSGGWYLGQGNTLKFFVDFDGATDLNVFSTQGIPLNRWQHVVVTWSGGSASTSVSLYQDGVPVTIGGIDGTGGRVSDATTALHIGNDNGQVRTFDGIIDEVRIYNRVLTPAEIQKVYKAGSVKVNTSLPKAPTLQTGLVGYWSFNGPDFTDKVYDRSGQNNHGYIYGVATNTVKKAGKVGQGIFFNNGVGQVTVPPSSSINSLVNKSIAFWVRIKSEMPGSIIEKNYWQIGYLGNGNLNFIQVTTALNGLWRIVVPPNNKWHHVVVTFNNSSNANTPLIYVNGALTSLVTDQSPTGTWLKNDSGVDLLTGFNFDGSIDEVRIYNRILSASEIKQLYQNESGSTVGFMCGKDTVTDADGNVYGTMKIGVQCWMKQNMRVGTRINVATAQSNNATIEKYCYDDTASNCTSNHPNQPDGGLYQWDEAMQYSTKPRSRGICPQGWHIPTHDEFTTLERNVCTSGSCATDFPYDTSTTGYRGTNEGTKLKPNGTSNWEGNLAGYSLGGSFLTRGSSGVFWSSSESGGSAWYRYLFSGSAQVSRGANVKSGGLSVRCLKD